MIIWTVSLFRFCLVLLCSSSNRLYCCYIYYYFILSDYSVLFCYLLYIFLSLNCADFLDFLFFLSRINRYLRFSKWKQPNFLRDEEVVFQPSKAPRTVNMRTHNFSMDTDLNYVFNLSATHARVDLWPDLELEVLINESDPLRPSDGRNCSAVCTAHLDMVTSFIADVRNSSHYEIFSLSHIMYLTIIGVLMFNIETARQNFL